MKMKIQDKVLIIMLLLISTIIVVGIIVVIKSDIESKECLSEIADRYCMNYDAVSSNVNYQNFDCIDENRQISKHPFFDKEKKQCYD